MFGKILYISDNVAHVQNLNTGNETADLMNLHVIFESNDQRILGEITEINADVIKIRFLGEYQGDKYINGVLRKPLLSSSIRVINTNELMALVGEYSENSFILGQSAIYRQFTVCPNINDLFSNHLCIFGNSGSGKSCGVSRIIQNIFENKYAAAKNANFFFFDAYGEYKNAFCKLQEINSEYCYKFITTNPQEESDERLAIPVNLLTLDDYALLLQANTHTQLPILEKTLKLAKIFATDTEESHAYKNHLIAKALIAILFSSSTTAQKKNEIFTIIETCHTPEFNFDTTIQGLGYTRSFSECFEIDSNGYFGESVLITEYILNFINEDLENIEPDSKAYYSLKDYAKALEFCLISEGFLHNDTLIDEASILRVRINTIAGGIVGTYFVGDKYVSNTEFIDNLKSIKGRKAQIININLEDIDDVYAKVIVKIFSKFLFEYAKGLKERATMPFHLFLEEAHRYIQKDNDTFLLGYNIFDRIAKEGRKYGVILDIISQRPVEISETVTAQCSNFLIFKMTHPLDIKYIEEMLPNMSSDVMEKLKTLQPGTCVAFGTAFKIPMICRLEMPNPTPYSSSCDVSNCWHQNITVVDSAPLEQDISKSNQGEVAPSLNSDFTTAVNIPSPENQAI